MNRRRPDYGQISDAARSLGVSRQCVHNRMRLKCMTIDEARKVPNLRRRWTPAEDGAVIEAAQSGERHWVKRVAAKLDRSADTVAVRWYCKLKKELPA